ncbi:hypothetical protein B0H14DRAFT_3860548 [Mycena olivaceomarginata]|nr:hypothetical protein B0H14DRAFT_3860548 [Mycena olivaceomarginata]
MGAIVNLLVVVLGCIAATPSVFAHHPHDDDPQCKPGLYPFFERNSLKFTAPLHKVTEITGTFFNLTWYADSIVNATTGIDNVVGATRAGLSGGVPFVEVLTVYDMTPSSLTISYYGAIPAYYNAPPSRTYIDVTTNACTNDPDLASVLAKRGHMSTLKLLATNVKGRIIDSQCPV